MKRFEGKTVLVTGASRGLGRAIAIQFAQEGAFVGVGFHLQENEAKNTLEEIEKTGGRASLVRMDIRDAQSVNSAVRLFIKENEKIDVLVNNAALVNDMPVVLMTDESWKSVIDTNLSGTFNCTRAVARSMIARKKGAIVNIGSVAGTGASPGQANYSASKGGIVSFTKTLAAELGPGGIRVNAIVPGLLTEGMAQKLDRRKAQNYKDRIPLGRFGDPREVARAVTFIASEEAGYIIGQALHVDGGLTL